MKIIIDTREQRPWTFPPWIETERAYINAGDYCLDGDDFVIERKSINDFVQTVSSGWDRLVREIKRAKKIIVIVEGNLDDFHFDETVNPPKHRSHKLTPAFIRRRISDLIMMGVPVIFAGNASLASIMALSVFYRRQNEIRSNTDNG